MIGFLLASVIVSALTAGYSLADYNKVAVDGLIGPIRDLRTWTFIFCFLSIGLTTRLRDLAAAGPRPLGAFTTGALVNVALGFVLSANVFASHWATLGQYGVSVGDPVRRCGSCASSIVDPHQLEAALAGLSIFSFATASVRACDGLCGHHDILVPASAWCADFALRRGRAVDDQAV